MQEGVEDIAEALCRKNMTPFCIRIRKCMYETWFHQDVDIIHPSFILPVVILVVSRESHKWAQVFYMLVEKRRRERVAVHYLNSPNSLQGRMVQPVPALHPIAPTLPGSEGRMQAHSKGSVEEWTATIGQIIKWTHSSSPHCLSTWSSFLCDLSDSRSRIWHNWRCCKFQLVPSI